MGCISSPNRSAVRAMKSVGDSSSGLFVAHLSPRTSFSWFRRSTDTREGIQNKIETEGRKKWCGCRDGKKRRNVNPSSPTLSCSLLTFQTLSHHFSPLLESSCQDPVTGREKEGGEIEREGERKGGNDIKDNNMNKVGRRK
jgi:hypothetical protein